MTLQEAADNIGHEVNYVPHPHHAERGVITAVTSRYVFVRYDGDGHGCPCEVLDIDEETREKAKRDLEAY